MSTRQSDNVILNATATKALLTGIKTATDAIRISYGAKGVNAVIEQEMYPYHIVANDCETILQSIQVTDRYGKIGLDLLKELSTKAHKDSGDGRKTTCIIGEEIITRGFRKNTVGVDLKRELDNLIPVVEALIDKQKRTITPDDVEKVATIAGESAEMGKILGDIYKVIGKDGIIHPEASGTYSTTYTFKEGIRFTDTGYLSPFMVHDPEAKKDGRRQTQAVYVNPSILVTKRKIASLDDINPLLATLERHGKKDLVIFTDDMDSEVARLLVKAHTDGVFNILIIKAPVMFKQYVFEDFALVTGSTIVEDSTGINYKNLRLDHLGTCGKIVVDKEETIITGGSDITDHVAVLREQSKGDDTPSNEAKLRLSWLTAKTCILRIGANNESELSYRRLKCYDAINASKLALRDGIVPGGGVALLNAALSLPRNKHAAQLLSQSLIEPYRQILKNSGEVPEKFIGNEALRGGPNWGYDCRSGQFVDMWTTGIVDAAAVVKNAVRNAISLASTVLTGRIIIALPEKTAEQVAADVLKNKGLRL